MDHPAGKISLTGTADFCDRYFVEFQRLEWFRVPQRTHREHVTGPDVDYLCSSEITLTSSVPLIVDGRFIGISCLDVLVESWEDILMAPGRADGARVTIVNGDGQVVVSNNPRRSTGDSIGDDTPAGKAALCRRAPFRVIAE